MNETNVTFFQIKPQFSPHYFVSDGNCMFMNECFSTENINYISAVRMKGIQLYEFDVEFCSREGKTVTFEFNAKGTALKAQRELARAFTRTGEFEREKSTDDTERGSTVGDSNGEEVSS